MSSPYCNGKRARHMGQPASANPYRPRLYDGVLKREWDRGWVENPPPPP